jgi:hypothetical protein
MRLAGEALAMDQDQGGQMSLRKIAQKATQPNF